MFDIGALELVVIAAVGLIVLGPERLPEVLRTTGLWIRRLRRSFNDIRADVEREAKLGDIKRELQGLGVQSGLKQVTDDIDKLRQRDFVNGELSGHDAAPTNRLSATTSTAAAEPAEQEISVRLQPEGAADNS